MDWKLIGTTFAVVFIAELGDKTQLATFGLASQPGSKLAVLLGASAALVATTVIAVLLGDAVGRLVPAHWLKRGAGVLFVVLGVLALAGSKAEPPASPSAGEGAS